MLLQQRNFSLLAHIQELRKCVLRALVWFAIALLFCFFFMRPLLTYLKRPYEVIAKNLVINNHNLNALTLFEVITINCKICVLLALFFSMPLIMYELWKFIVPALYSSEKKIARLLLISSVLLFYIGVFFCYFVLLPCFFENALMWASSYAMLSISYSSYFNTLSTMLLLFAIIFELPVIICILGLAKLIRAELLIKNRKIIFLACFIIGAILAPPDVFSLCLVAIPMYTMIEAAIFILKYIEKDKKIL